ncbi:OmpA family protein [Sphingomonas sp. S1-29]|uniref:OmpA family protein n=1 Tax=Sphingomonas sp. S1-29 TaxID=2991074 RepID=UPI0022405815|nr:OmpA family protein [Sphingomonas sp. S1-29]UZK68895.1 OmpA family protein [Sphingomonas sp. S1-29]
MARFDAAAPARPVWLMTLADLALLLVGFFVFVQASQLDRGTLASAIRAGFDTPEPTAPIALDRAIVRGFAVGEAALPPSIATASRWAATAARDPRTRLLVTGHVDGSLADRDTLGDNAALLASDRARAVAEALVRAGVVGRDRIVISTDPAPRGRHVTLAIGFAGSDPTPRQAAAARQPLLAAPQDRNQK